MEWRKSSYTGNSGTCVEVRQDHKAVRDSKHLSVDLPVSRAAWHSFVRNVRS